MVAGSKKGMMAKTKMNEKILVTLFVLIPPTGSNPHCLGLFGPANPKFPRKNPADVDIFVPWKI